MLSGAYLTVQWLRLCLPNWGVQAQSLVRKLRSHVLCSQKKKKKHKTKTIL